MITTYISFADIFVKPIARACCFPSAIIAWENLGLQIRVLRDKNVSYFIYISSEHENPVIP